MKRGQFRPGAAPARPVQPRPVEWSQAIEHALRLARAAETPGVTGDPGDLMQFRLRVRDLTAESFPPPAEASRLVAGSFLNAARAFAHPAAEPELRTACAPLLRDGARVCDRLLHLHQTARAGATWARREFD